MHFSLTMMAIAILTAEFLWPVEDAASGRGLHLVVLWLMLGMLHALARWRSAGIESERRRAPFGLMDWSILLIAVGHVVSTAVVFQVEGDRRSALNLTFEWLAIFTAWRLFRCLSLDRLQASRIVSALVAIGVGLSAFGIWQHHFFYAEQSSWYLSKRAELDGALAAGGGSGSVDASSIIAEFQQADIPLEGSDRILWENRLLSSSEPFGTFSLANTLAGVLATALILLAGQVTADWSQGRRHSVVKLMLLAVQLALLAYCLVLTKSRSAWLGAMVGSMALMLIRSRASVAVKGLRWGIAAASLAGIVAGTAAFFGALDKEVILESPRSLQFRLLYWTGTLQMLKEQPLLGVGPGNFRQMYLKHKANESSEEIKDPHNFLLESWSAGGLLGLSGMMLFVGGVLRRLGTAANADLMNVQSPILNARRSWKLLPAGLLMGFALQAGWQWIQGHSILPDQMSSLLLLLGVAFVLLKGGTNIRPVDSVTGLAAALALMIHLLAAGGFEMPAIMLLLLICGGLGVSHQEGSSSPAEVRSSPPTEQSVHWASLPAAITCLSLAVIVLNFGLSPVYTAERDVSIGDDAMYRQRNPQSAQAAYRQAAENDPFGVFSRQRIAELETYRLSEQEQVLTLFMADTNNRQLAEEAAEANRQAIREMLPKAIEASDFMILADRRNIFGYRSKAVCLSIGARVLNDPEMLKEAIAEQQRVVNMYPSSVENWSELATLCNLVSHDPERGPSETGDAASELARQAAEKALELEEINRQWGHQDRYLTKERFEAMTEILSR